MFLPSVLVKRMVLQVLYIAICALTLIHGSKDTDTDSVISYLSLLLWTQTLVKSKGVAPN